MREQMTNVALAGARNMFRMVILTRNWNASHGGIYVPVTQRVAPNPYLDHPQRDLLARLRIFRRELPRDGSRREHLDDRVEPERDERR